MSGRGTFLLALTSMCFMEMAISLSPVGSQAVAEEPRMATFDAATGETYFALSLSPTSALPKATAHDVVVLFDTSASQTGVYRDDALEALKTMLAALGEQDRVHLMAVDLNAMPMTAGFVAPTGAAMSAALDKLERRAPLGSTDMLGALRSAAETFTPEKNHAHAIVYIGDGVSRANVMADDEFQSVVASLVDRQAAFNSFAIGPQRDAQLLATLANHSGGMLYLDTDQNTAQQAGLALSQAALGTVLWPVEARLPAEFVEVYPRQLPPLRAGRDSVLIGLVKGQGPYEASATYEVNGQPVQQTWQLKREPSTPDFGFLPQLITLARPDDGLRLPTVGSAGLREVAHVLNTSANQLAELGGHALRTGDISGARTAADAAEARDPGNPQAVALRSAIERFGADDAQAEEELKLVNLQETDLPGDVGVDLEGPTGALLDQVEAAKRVQSEAVQAEVETGLNQARQKMATNPDDAVQSLKILSERVNTEPDLDAEVRTELLQRISSSIREAGRIRLEVETRLPQAEVSMGAAVEAERLAEETTRNRQKIKQLLDRFNSLLDEGKYLAADQDVAAQVEAIDPDAVIGRSARWNARNLKNMQEMERFRDLRHRNFADTLYQVEQSAIPFPDEPPIIYPAAEVWEAISMRRKQWASVDLSGKSNSAESRILQALEKETNFDYLDTPLKEVVDDIAFNNNIPIVLDTKALEELGVDTAQPITRNLKGVTLRSALRLMLNELELTYIIKDEVLQITTPDKAESQLITKVYPVGDLVIPVISGGGQFGGGGGQGGGGFGGGGGGFGGGGGGFGGGGGGGFFDVEDELSLGVKTEPKPAVEKPRVETVRIPNTKPQAIRLDRKSGESLPDAWSRHFAAHRGDSAAEIVVHQAQIRETVRQLKADAQSYFNAEKVEAGQAKLEEIIAITQAAVRNGQPQPWMYEAMSLAMLASGAPVEDIERALMSAVDFSRNEEEVLFVADFMSRLGLDERALKLYREVAEASPLRPEPYVQGLNLAERIHDEQGLQWACVGLLGQAWEQEHRGIEDRATRTAKALLKQMQDEDRTEEASRFLAQLNESVKRDCVVRVTWTGDADIDLLVEEPTATVCSLRNTRTTAGGVMLGDSYAHSNSDALDGFSEVYVCPTAFSGQYRLLLRRVWGQVAAGKATVEIWTNYGSPNQTYGKQQIPLGEKDAVVNFEVSDGRRKEPVAEEKLAKIDRSRMEVGHAILAQQMQGLGGSSSLIDYALSVQQAMRSGVVNPAWFGRRGAVGFMPQVTSFPEGNQMNALAIIDASRRYVRFSLLGSAPISSGITNVDTFNFVTGQSGQGGGGQGGGGLGGGQGGGFGGGGFGGGGFCWVAREVYGADNPKWLVFRDWLSNDAPSWLYNLYAVRGERFAGWIKDKPIVKLSVRWLMDRAIAGREDREFLAVQ